MLPTASPRPAGRAAAIWENLREQIRLRGDEFIGQHVSRGSAGLSEITTVDEPASTRAVVAAPEDTPAVAEATLDHVVTLEGIASHLGVHDATVSRRGRQRAIGPSGTA